jgi:CubicO group peptidase (beta-lactamase class C family)
MKPKLSRLPARHWLGLFILVARADESEGSLGGGGSSLPFPLLKSKFLINTEDVEGFRSAGSLTWGGVHNTYFWIDLKRRITAVALMQILPIGDPHVQEKMIAFERTLYAAISSVA